MALNPPDFEHRSSLGEKDHVLETEFARYPTAHEGRVLGDGDTVLCRIQRFAGKFGIEQRGIERVLPEERTDTNLSKIGTLVSNPIEVI